MQRPQGRKEPDSFGSFREASVASEASEGSARRRAGERPEGHVASLTVCIKDRSLSETGAAEVTRSRSDMLRVVVFFFNFNFVFIHVFIFTAAWGL